MSLCSVFGIANSSPSCNSSIRACRSSGTGPGNRTCKPPTNCSCRSARASPVTSRSRRRPACGSDVVFPAPDPADQGIVRQHPSGVHRERMEQLVLRGGQLHGAAAHAHPALRVVDHQFARNPRIGEPVNVAEGSRDSRHQLSRREGQCSRRLLPPAPPRPSHCGRSPK